MSNKPSRWKHGDPPKDFKVVYGTDDGGVHEQETIEFTPEELKDAQTPGPLSQHETKPIVSVTKQIRGGVQTVSLLAEVPMIPGDTTSLADDPNIGEWLHKVGAEIQNLFKKLHKSTRRASSRRKAQ